MPEVSVKCLRIACLILAGILVYQLAMVAKRWNPYAGLHIPELAALPSTNAVAKAKSGDGKTPKPANGGTNATAKSTNAAPKIAAGSNSVPATNAAAPVPVVVDTVATGNPPMVMEPPDVVVNMPGGMPASPPTEITEGLPPGIVLPPGIELPPGVTLPPGINLDGAGAPGGSPVPGGAKRAGSGRGKSRAMPPGMPGGMPEGMPGGGPPPEMLAAMMGGGGMPNFGGGMPMGGPPGNVNVPEAIKARVDKIVNSEILGMIMHPQPMALMGIAGKNIFLRTPTGQTGMIKEGEELGGVKLIRIGTNHVLVEENGQQRELTINAGLGGESLLTKPKDKP